ncbi:GNAT family N-acetyltransferase [Aquibium oceanicum]|uniref:GNAT family N-acetyltransferase n=1 Tax=Aquibium oceanicum TaxID=1670800 RepID=UPI001F1801BC|nr:GNAT family N-acetyltransferase [Aquibium oceanicum]
MRPARPDDIEALIEAETAAAKLFGEHGYPQLAEEAPPSPAALEESLDRHDVIVAADDADRAIGYAMALVIGDTYWLCELSVHPAHGRRGVGTALLSAFLDAARRCGCRRAGLSTFRRVPFNAPFYARHGFVESGADEADSALRDRFQREVPDGIDPSERVMMLRVL